MTTSNSIKIIGIGGMPRSGKDTLADLFMENGYFGFSFGDFTRQNSFERHKDKPDPISVANMTETSNYMRNKYGPDVILKEALKEFEKASKTKDYKGLVLFSLRAPIEVDWILEKGGELIWVEASDKVRYRRAMKALRPGEAEISLDEFKRQEQLQWQPQAGVPTEAQMNLSYVKNHATKTIKNEGSDFDVFISDTKEDLRQFF